MKHSKQNFYCNNCGKEVVGTWADLLGGSRTMPWRTCSVPCMREIHWKETLSIMGKEYYPHPDPNYHNPDYNPDTGKKY